jgi:cysteine desulfurase
VSAYLDWNATSPPHPTVLDAMRLEAAEAWANPSSVHGPGRRARDRVESARERLAAALAVEARDVVFTGGGTEANHLALAGASCIVTSRLEHPSVVLEAERLARLGVPVHFVRVTADGLVDVASLELTLAEVGRAEAKAGSGSSPGLVVAVMAANHETGVVQPLADIARVVHETGAWLHVDAVQLLGRAPLAALGVADSIAVAAHKLRGPKGIGALAWRNGRRPRSRGAGGSQERGLRAGTVDALACVGFGAALARLDASVRRYAEVQRLRDRFEVELFARARTTPEVHGARAGRLPHVSNFSLPGERGDELVAALDLLGVCVSSGSACAAGTAEPSPVITAMAGVAAARCALRVSFGEDSGELDLEALLGALAKLGLLLQTSSDP